jgi:prolyl-tRNA synthetase
MAEQEGIIVKKSENFSEWYTQVVQKAELADIRYNVKGFLVHQPWSVKTMKIINDFLEEELEKNGHEPVWFPSVIPESNLEKEKEHAKGFSAEVFWVTEAGSNHEKLEEKLALRPTSETAMCPMFSIWIRSWRDLPLKTYQNCQVWRYEPVTRPFLRGREFYWIEAHDAFASKEDAEKQVEEDMKMVENIFEKCALPFLFFKRPEHDKFKGAVNTFAADSIMPDGRAIQLPSTHFLGQNFSKAFNIKFVDKDKSEKYVWQTCYGPCVWRIYGALIAIHGDDKGLVLPPLVSPLQAIIIPIFKTTEEKKVVIKKCNLIKDVLEKNQIRVKIDTREEFTPGWKYNYWELKGVSIRIEIGPRDVKKKQIVLVRRDLKEEMDVKDKLMIKTVESLLNKIQEDLKKKGETYFKSFVSEAGDFKSLKKILEDRGGFVRANWCGSVECADSIKAETNGGVIRGTLFNKKEKVFDKCVWCNKEANEVVYIAKQY